MVIRIFDFLTNALYSNIFFVIAASFAWGILSVILSPCHLSAIPLLIAYIGGQGRIPVRKAFFLSLIFALGLLVTIALIGILTGLAGRMLGDLGVMNNVFVIIVALIFFAVGLNFLGIIPSPGFLNKGMQGIKNKGLLPAFFMGLLFGVVLGPCTFGFMAPVLGVVFGLSAKNIMLSALILIMFASGHCLVIILAGTFTEVVQKYLNWDEKSKASEIIKKIFGIIIIIIGIYLVIKNFKII